MSPLPVPAGDPSVHLSAEQLAAGWAALPAPPTDEGRVVGLVVRRGDLRDEPESIEITVEDGVLGDRWAAGDNPDQQVTAARLDFTELIANGQPAALAGDNIFLDLDLSESNAPIHSKLRIGPALLEITPKPHRGCWKFAQRFGAPALRMASHPDWIHLHLRGIHLRVLEPGRITVGDPVQLLRL